MPSVADCLGQHAPAYLARFGEKVPLGHRKLISVITRCRTGALGGVAYHCDGCGREHWVGRSCGNRHCPACGNEKTYRWLEKQADRLLPVHHFLVTFTVPKELRLVLRRHQRDGYRCLFDSGAQSIRDVGSATRALKGCQLGFFGVLHTWGRDPMVYHPHVHFVIPGGGVRLDDNGGAVAWQSTAENFLFHHGTLVEVYKAKLADQLRRCGLYDSVPRETWAKSFVVDIQPVGDGRAVLKYLAPYIHRVAISDHRIVACDDSSVTYRYKPSGSKQWKTRKVQGDRFVGGFLQHKLPGSFQKVRYYGWMSAGSSIGLDEIRWLVWLFLGWTYWLASGHAPQESLHQAREVRCAQCGGRMRVVAVTFDPVTVLSEHALAYLDSG
ncbi:MAG: transposase [Pirellulales bacterium]|nr:transposase [Pirellulales bacterium]